MYFEETTLQMKEILHRNERTYALIFKQTDGRNCRYHNFFLLLESKGGERKLRGVVGVRKDLFSSRVPEICHSPDDDEEDDDDEEEEDDDDADDADDADDEHADDDGDHEDEDDEDEKEDDGNCRYHNFFLLLVSLSKWF